jgi:hypothetical protein
MQRIKRLIKFLCFKARKFKQKIVFKTANRLFKIHFNVLIISTQKFLKQSLPFRVTNRNITRVSQYVTVTTYAVHLHLITCGCKQKLSGSSLWNSLHSHYKAHSILLSTPLNVCSLIRVGVKFRTHTKVADSNLNYYITVTVSADFLPAGLWNT